MKIELTRQIYNAIAFFLSSLVRVDTSTAWRKKMLICDILVSAYYVVLSQIKKLYSCLIRHMVM